MCTYARTVFECRHQYWGRRLKLCTIGDDFNAGRLPRDCAAHKPHGLHSRRVARRCDKCRLLDHKIILMRAKLTECLEAFRSRWPDYYWPDKSADELRDEKPTMAWERHAKGTERETTKAERGGGKIEPWPTRRGYEGGRWGGAAMERKPGI